MSEDPDTDETTYSRDEMNMILDMEAAIRREVSRGGAGAYLIALAIMEHLKAAGWVGPLR